MGEFHVDPVERPSDPNWRWWKELTRYHWFVLAVSALGWIFDCLDQQLFNLARVPAMKDLLGGAAASQKDVDFWGGVSTAIFMIGWATGGIIFGILGDKIGRAKTMLWTILIYSLCTGLSALSTTVYDFGVYRFLTGLGVGGEFAVGVALVAEVMPDRARPFALGLLQALSTVGNVSAALISISFAELEESGVLGEINLFGFKMNQWRAMFVIGTLPALLAIVIRARLKEPERWKTAVVGDKEHKAGSLAELFGDPRWRHRAVVGMLLATVGVVGLWGIGFFSIDLNRSVFMRHFDQQHRENGEHLSDQKFLGQLLAQPNAEALLKQAAEAKLTEGDFVTLEVKEQEPRQKARDPHVIFAAATKLLGTKQPVSANAVLDKLDAENPLPESQAADRARREAYLAEGAVATTPVDFAKQTAAIADRAKATRKSNSIWAGITSLMFNVGAFFGIYTFSRLTHRWGRKPAFALAFTGAMISTIAVFWFINRPTDVFWMTPIMGYCQISLFGGYAIYFPELFPTRLRSTGTSFCYNVGRFIAAFGPFVLGLLASKVFQNTSEPLRFSGIVMCSIFLVGLIVLPFAPETKGKPLPE